MTPGDTMRLRDLLGQAAEALGLEDVTITLDRALKTAVAKEGGWMAWEPGDVVHVTLRARKKASPGT